MKHAGITFPYIFKEAHFFFNEHLFLCDNSGIVLIMEIISYTILYPPIHISATLLIHHRKSDRQSNFINVLDMHCQSSLSFLLPGLCPLHICSHNICSNFKLSSLLTEPNGIDYHLVLNQWMGPQGIMELWIR